MRALLFIFLLLPSALLSQSDRIYFVNGKVIEGQVVSVGLKTVFVKLSDTSFRTSTIDKRDILLIEKYDGKVLVFGKKDAVKDSTKKPAKIYTNAISFEPLNVFVGRVTGCYEYTNKKGTVGFLIPATLTFDPVGPIFKPDADTSRNRRTPRVHQEGVNFITGLDVNFYVGKKDYRGWFVGPRIRYGVDMFMMNIEGYSFQTQFGMKVGEGERVFHQFSLGFGFVRILSSPAGNRINPKESYGWMSINYRIGLNL